MLLTKIAVEKRPTMATTARKVNAFNNQRLGLPKTTKAYLGQNIFDLIMLGLGHFTSLESRIGDLLESSQVQNQFLFLLAGVEMHCC